VWTTDKDGLILGLLAAEITAVTGRDPSELYNSLTQELGTAWYARTDAPASSAQKQVFKTLTPEGLGAAQLGGDPVTQTLTKAPGNGQSFGGIKVATANGWFAARPSGTEEVYKIYAESFRSEDHLRRVQDDAKALIGHAFAAAGQGRA
jgi:phosphoglucomutase